MSLIVVDRCIQHISFLTFKIYPKKIFNTIFKIDAYNITFLKINSSLIRIIAFQNSTNLIYKFNSLSPYFNNSNACYYVNRKYNLILLIPGKDNKLIPPVIVNKERSLIHQKPSCRILIRHMLAVCKLISIVLSMNQ